MNTWIVSDVHGAGLELQILIDQINNVYPHNHYIIAGDGFDRGMHSHIVWDLIQKYNIRFCLGNHENKMIQYLSGERDSLGKHYFWALNNLVNHGVDIEEFYNWLLTLPLLIPIEKNGKKFIITHAGVNLENPYKQDIGANVYCNFSPEEAMPKPLESDEKVYWWDRYSHPEIVIYGHLVSQDHLPRIRRGFNGQINSIGIDTGIVHGLAITAYNLEKGIFVQYCSGINWFGELKQITFKEYPSPLKKIKNFAERKKI